MSDVRGEIALTFGCESAALIGVLHPGAAQAQRTEEANEFS